MIKDEVLPKRLSSVGEANSSLENSKNMGHNSAEAFLSSADEKNNQRGIPLDETLNETFDLT